MSGARLFDVDLVYDPDAQAVQEGDALPFAYIGSGHGAVAGPSVEGELRWSLYEEQTELVCRARRTGVIETADGATIEIEELGYFGREDQDASLWHFTGGIRFKTADERYGWLTRRPALLEGTMDLSTGRGRLSVTAPDGSR